MSMNNDDLERTGLYRLMLEEREPEDGTLSELDEIQERLAYMDINEDKKKKYLKLIEEIQAEKEEATRDFLFHQLAKIINNEE